MLDHRRPQAALSASLAARPARAILTEQPTPRPHSADKKASKMRLAVRALALALLLGAAAAAETAAQSADSAAAATGEAAAAGENAANPYDPYWRPPQQQVGGCLRATRAARCMPPTARPLPRQDARPPTRSRPRPPARAQWNGGKGWSGGKGYRDPWRNNNGWGNNDWRYNNNGWGNNGWGNNNGGWGNDPWRNNDPWRGGYRAPAVIAQPGIGVSAGGVSVGIGGIPGLVFGRKLMGGSRKVGARGWRGV